MKKHILLVLILFVCITKSSGQCNNGTGSNIYTKQASYNCHQFVRAALIGNYVNLTTGVPVSNESQFTSLYSTASIATDQDFIRVCSSADAKAVVPVGNGADHSSIILNNGIFASTPNGSTQYIYTHQNPRTFTTACSEEYYAPIPQITISGTSAVNQGMQFTLTLTNNGQSFPTFLQLADTYWSFSTTYFTLVSKTATSITLIASNVTGSSDVKYNLFTGCNGTNYFRTKQIQILPNCTGTLNGGSLYTFNYVASGSNQVVMFLNSWTWVKTSGNASWSTSNGGKNMTFTVSSGCATFNAYNSSCNLTFTFCKSSSFRSYIVMDMKTLKVIKEGTVENLEEINALLNELPLGGYVINIDGKTTRYVKSE
jgi:hypothetical protein